MGSYIKFLFKKYILRRKGLVNPKTGEYDLKYNTKAFSKDFFIGQGGSHEENSERMIRIPNKELVTKFIKKANLQFVLQSAKTIRRAKWKKRKK